MIVFSSRMTVLWWAITCAIEYRTKTVLFETVEIRVPAIHFAIF